MIPRTAKNGTLFLEVTDQTKPDWKRTIRKDSPYTPVSAEIWIKARFIY
jgi:hypothetical protein